VSGVNKADAGKKPMVAQGLLRITPLRVRGGAKAGRQDRGYVGGCMPVSNTVAVRHSN
jgi:hypothetical protein